MNKWDYIRLISKRGTADGLHGGVLDLLLWCNKPNTASVTEDEARAFWERIACDHPPGDCAPAPQK